MLIKEIVKAETKRSTHYPLKERAAAVGAERLLEGRNAEGSFRAGGPKVTAVTVSPHDLSPLSDRTLQEVF